MQMQALAVGLLLVGAAAWFPGGGQGGLRVLSIWVNPFASVRLFAMDQARDALHPSTSPAGVLAISVPERPSPRD
jgi:hypothetical protein